MQTNIRSLLGAISRILNLINPEMTHHHEQTAYLAYQIAEEMGLNEGSRIMAVADIFSAITEVRPYRAGMNKEQAQGVLTENAERGEICGEIVELLLKHYDEVDAVREQRSREVGKRYYESLGMEEPDAEL